MGYRQSDIPTQKYGKRLLQHKYENQTPNQQRIIGEENSKKRPKLCGNQSFLGSKNQLSSPELISTNSGDKPIKEFERIQKLIIALQHVL